MIFHRGAAQGQAVLRLQEATGFGGLGIGVFDRLRFIENGVVKMKVFKFDNI